MSAATHIQLSEQAADQIEKYLFEVARTTNCAFPFHEISKALQAMHLVPRLENPALCDIVPEDANLKGLKTEEDLLSFWARELRQRVHQSDFTVTL